MQTPLVGIIVGSDSDLGVMQQAAIILGEFEIPFEITVVSAHQSPNRLAEYAAQASSRGIHVIIAGASGVAHLPGMSAAHTVLPVIGVPIAAGELQGLDSLLSMVQMPEGVPVATVGMNAARNAGLLAAQILSVKDPSIIVKVANYKKRQEEEVLRKAENLEETGFERYLQGKGPL